jgi:DNA repair protein RecO (recombination protein O)
MNSHHSVKDEAIILRKKNFGEADVLLTLLTRNNGKLRVIAKGARKTTSRLVGHIELFSIISGQINLQPTIPILSQVNVEHSIIGLAEDATALQRISLLSEVVDRAMEEGVIHEDIYRVLAEGSLRLRQQDQPLLFMGILMRLLGQLGYAPELSLCVVCKIRLEAGGRFAWDHSAGGVVTDNCITGTMQQITGESLKALRFLQRQPITEMSRLVGEGEVVDQLHNVLIHYARYVLEQPLMSATVSYRDTQLLQT